MPARGRGLEEPELGLEVLCSRYSAGSIGQNMSVPYMIVAGGSVSIDRCQTSSW